MITEPFTVVENKNNNGVRWYSICYRDKLIFYTRNRKIVTKYLDFNQQVSSQQSA